MRGWPTSAVSLLLLFTTSVVLAVPPAPPGCLPSSFPQAPWRRFTNQIIAKILGHDTLNKVHVDVNNKASNKVENGRVSARYGQDIVLRFNVTTARDASALAEAAEDLYLDVWEFNDDWVDIRLARDVVPSLLGLLPESLQKAHAPLMPQSGLAEIISQSRPSGHQIPFTPTLEPHSKDLFFGDYQPLAVITPWMNLMASMFPTHARLINIGVSWEGRDIQALRVGVHPTNDELPPIPRKTIVISGGIHAREWISTSTVLYVANQVIISYGRSPVWTSLLESFDFVFIPTANPDGYVYTWETDRLWRKNRQPTSLRFCHGIDLDRAFGFEWDGDASTSNPCSESYPGEESWQAVEAEQLASWTKNETETGKSDFVGLLDLHSYSQQVLYPYSYSCNAAPPTLEDLEEVAMGLAKAMRLANQGHLYRTTSACEGNVAILKKDGQPDAKKILPRIEFGGGSLLDWFYHELKIKYAFQIKLRDTGSYGFLLPKSNIVPQGKEMFNAVTYLGKFLIGSIGIEEESSSNAKPELKKPNLQEEEEEVSEQPESNIAHELITEQSDSSIEWELRRRRRR